MANIKNLQMWNTICKDLRIDISKSMFGLKTKVIYKKSGSPIKARTIEYSPIDGEKLKLILNTPAEQMTKVIGDYRPKPIVNGNYMIEICMSVDKQFIALQLFQFNRMNYEPIMDILTLEGKEAETIGEIF